MIKHNYFENIIGIVVGIGLIVVSFVLSILFGLLLQLSMENSQKFNETIMMINEFRSQLSKGIVIIFTIVFVIITIKWSYILIKHKNLE